MSATFESSSTQSTYADGVADDDSRAAPSNSLSKAGKISKGEIVDLTAQLAIMTKSGVDVATALETLASQSAKPESGVIISHIHELVMSGAAFSDALKQYEHVFGATYVATVAAGEASGEMSEVLQQLAHMQRSEMKLSGTIRALLAYPVLLASISSLVIIALVLFVLPQFAQIFADYDTPLPWLTTVLLAIAGELRGRWYVYGPLTIIGVVGSIIYLRTDNGRQSRDWFLLHGWMIRDITRRLLWGRVCKLLGFMIDSGVPLLDCIRLAQKSTSNILYRRLFEQLEEEVVNGRGIATVLSQCEVIPDSAAEMLITGERTGKLGEVASLIGAHFEEEGEERMRRNMALLEPLMTVVMGLIVAVVVLAVMLPMFDLATFAQK